MKKSISKKMLLPILLASFCSGANASETPFAQNKFQSGVLNKNVNVSDSAKTGFSGSAMAGSNILSGVGGATLGYYLGMQNTPKGPKNPKVPTQEEFDKVVADRDELQKEVNKIKNSNPDAEKILKLEIENSALKNENQQLNTDLEKKTPYWCSANLAFDNFKIPSDQRAKKLSQLLDGSLAFLNRRAGVDAGAGSYGTLMQLLGVTVQNIKSAGKGYSDAVDYLLGKNDNADAWSTLSASEFKDFEVNNGFLSRRGGAGMAHMLGEMVRYLSKIINKLDHELGKV